MKKFRGEKLSEEEIEAKIEDLRMRESKVKKLNKREHRILNQRLCQKDQIEKEQKQINQKGEK